MVEYMVYLLLVGYMPLPLRLAAGELLAPAEVGKMWRDASVAAGGPVKNGRSIIRRASA
ncbi:MAG TPA: hypothetical protein VKY65_05210 [Alphaproteobacteria bacterium]|nr:hypothetical protein [Alphaproteobacteria bacterium]